MKKYMQRLSTTNTIYKMLKTETRTVSHLNFTSRRGASKIICLKTGQLAKRPQE